MKQQSKKEKAKAAQRRLIDNDIYEGIPFQQTHIRFILPFLEHEQILEMRLVNKYFCQLINGIYTFLCCNIRETTLLQLQKLANSFCRAEHIVLPNIFDSKIEFNIENKDQVKSIEFHFVEFGKSYLEQYLEQFPQLRSLLFDQIHCIKQIKNIPIFETLSQLDLQGIYDMSVDLTILKHCKLLTSLSIQVHQTQSFFQKLNQSEVCFKLKQFKCRLWGPHLQPEEENHLKIFLQNQQTITQVELQNDIWREGEQRINIFNMFLDLPNLSIFYLKNLLLNEIQHLLFKQKLQKMITKFDTRGEKINFNLLMLEYLTIYTKVLDLTNLSKHQFEDQEYQIFNQFYEIYKEKDREVKILLPNDFIEVNQVSLGLLQMIKLDAFKSIMNIHKECMH